MSKKFWKKLKAFWKKMKTSRKLPKNLKMSSSTKNKEKTNSCISCICSMSRTTLFMSSSKHIFSIWKQIDLIQNQVNSTLTMSKTEKNDWRSLGFKANLLSVSLKRKFNEKLKVEWKSHLFLKHLMNLLL